MLVLGPYSSALIAIGGLVALWTIGAFATRQPLLSVGRPRRISQLLTLFWVGAITFAYLYLLTLGQSVACRRLRNPKCLAASDQRASIDASLAKHQGPGLLLIVGLPILIYLVEMLYARVRALPEHVSGTRFSNVALDRGSIALSILGVATFLSRLLRNPERGIPDLPNGILGFVAVLLTARAAGEAIGSHWHRPSVQ